MLQDRWLARTPSCDDSPIAARGYAAHRLQLPIEFMPPGDQSCLGIGFFTPVVFLEENPPASSLVHVPLVEPGLVAKPHRILGAAL